ncbi:MAG TPA: three-Cys-motif partner protein TcmP [Terriglobia bacterium]|nr:three-Cys-motif partner protein TcmP [Terriglobia bacterium]
MVTRGSLPDSVEDDGLATMEVCAWVETKHRLVALYDRLFSTGMKNKWDSRVYIDLYAGSGFARIAGSQRLIPGSPLLAMAVPDPFDKYIFCESSQVYMTALKQRVNRLFPGLAVEFVNGDCNERVEQICAAVPQPSTNRSVLSLCFLDPFDISLQFSTIRRLAQFYTDFLLLLALYMDANRNISNYLAVGNSKVEEFLGIADWRTRWKAADRERIEFPTFLAVQYAEQIKALGYLAVPLHRMKLVRSDEKNLPLYRLALFSRHSRAYEFWDEVLKYSTPQKNLFDE